MTSRLISLCFDANDPLALARFWAAALRWEIGSVSDDEVGLVPTDGTRFEILFLRAPGEKVGQNRLHLDLTTTSVDDQRESVARLVELGGRHIDIGQGPDDRHVVLADPEGNELCIIEPENNFLADCGRFGSITCDGTRDVGYFWSAALGWPLVWDQNEETAIRAPDLTGPLITWGGPPLAPSPEEPAASRHRSARARRSDSRGRASDRSERLTSAKVMSRGWSWPTPMATSSAC